MRVTAKAAVRPELFLYPSSRAPWMHYAKVLDLVIRIAAVRVRMSVDVQTFPGHGSSGAVSRPGAAAQRGIILVQVMYPPILT